MNVAALNWLFEGPAPKSSFRRSPEASEPPTEADVSVLSAAGANGGRSDAKGFDHSVSPSAAR
jgi:hypothetical protein